MLLQMGPLLHLGPVITLVPSTGGLPNMKLSLHSYPLLSCQMLFLKQFAKRDNAPEQGLARILAWLLEKRVCSHLSSSSNVLRDHARESSVNAA